MILKKSRFTIVLSIAFAVLSLQASAAEEISVNATPDAQACIDSAVSYALQHGPEIDRNRIALGTNVMSGAGTIAHYTFWFPIQDQNSGCYVIDIDSNSCRATNAYIRKSRWYQGCPIFDSRS